MSKGDFTIFDQALLNEGNGTLDYDTNTFKVAILDNTVTPTKSDASPVFSAYNEVGTLGSYTAGGETVTMTWTESSGTVTLDSGDVQWSANALNDSDAYWALLYQTTGACIGFLDLGGPVDMSADTLIISVPTGWLTKAS